MREPETRSQLGGYMLSLARALLKSLDSEVMSQGRGRASSQV
jgi:hypothetical protein